MGKLRAFGLFAAVTALLSLPSASPAADTGSPVQPAQVDCGKCHANLTIRMKVVHAAVTMGCSSCHSGIADALKVPHRKTNTITKGLSAEQPELCYGCHDRARFTKKTVHAAVGMGCTGCHNPHAGNSEKLLVAAVPDLCFNCHDKADFSRKNVHSPVAGGMCLTCHDPHSSDKPTLLVKAQYEVCFDCHEEVSKQPHAIAGFSRIGHPLGLPKKARKSGKESASDVKDPQRKGKLFGCASCHNPHSSDDIRLFRYPAKSSMQLCSHCHKY